MKRGKLMKKGGGLTRNDLDDIPGEIEFMSGSRDIGGHLNVQPASRLPLRREGRNLPPFSSRSFPAPTLLERQFLYYIREVKVTNYQPSSSSTCQCDVV